MHNIVLLSLRRKKNQPENRDIHLQMMPATESTTVRLKTAAKPNQQCAKKSPLPKKHIWRHWRQKKEGEEEGERYEKIPLLFPFCTIYSIVFSPSFLFFFSFFREILCRLGGVFSAPADVARKKKKRRRRRRRRRRSRRRPPPSQEAVTKFFEKDLALPVKT